jgi:hypothetical protein
VTTNTRSARPRSMIRFSHRPVGLELGMPPRALRDGLADHL